MGPMAIRYVAALLHLGVLALGLWPELLVPLALSPPFPTSQYCLAALLGQPASLRTPCYSTTLCSSTLLCHPRAPEAVTSSD